MNPKQLLVAAEALEWVSLRLKDLPESRGDALSASVHCTIASMVTIELAKHLADGIDPYEALRLAAIGTLIARPEKGETVRLLTGMATHAGDSTP